MLEFELVVYSVCGGVLGTGFCWFWNTTRSSSIQDCKSNRIDQWNGPVESPSFVRDRDRPGTAMRFHGNNGVSYTDILGGLSPSTGRLNYHLKQMDGFIQKNNLLRYTLTPLGKAAVDLVFSLGKDLPKDVEKFVKIRRPPSLMPALIFMAYLLMFVVSIPIIFVGGQIYSIIVGGGQLIEIVFLTVAMAIGLAIFVWIAYMVRYASGYLRHLEKRFYE